MSGEADYEAYRYDPTVHHLWDAALVYLHTLDVVDRNDHGAMDDPRVVELKDWLISIYTAGAKRSTVQLAAVDESLAVVAGLAPPPTIMLCHDCPKAEALLKAVGTDAGKGS